MGSRRPLSAGGLYLAQRTGLPHHSTMFWVPDQSLRLDCEGKRLRYRYPTSDGGRTLILSVSRNRCPRFLQARSCACPWPIGGGPKNGRRRSCAASRSCQGGSLISATGPREPLRRAPAPAAAGASATVETPAPAAVLQQRALAVLRRTFGYPQFFPVQSEAIFRILQRQDALVVMPTGGGKSLCYQLPSASI